MLSLRSCKSQLIVLHPKEHYFEMAKTDAEEALAIYKAFCKQNDRVVEYLNAARRLNHVIDVPVPNLKHVSSASGYRTTESCSLFFNRRQSPSSKRSRST